MKYLDLTLSTPQENLACDEALLDLCEGGNDDEILRFWEPREHFVVLGYSSKVSSEVNLRSCQANRIPVLRRFTGGGTVLQGPGCLNYSTILKIQSPGPLKGIVETNAFILEGHRETLSQIIGSEIRIQGSCDLAVGGMKFSGNAQYRRRRYLLFHGTFLLHLEIDLMEKILPVPAKQPPYRCNRSHQEFLANLELPSPVITEALKRRWNATERFGEVPFQRIKELVASRYSRDEWNFRS